MLTFLASSTLFGVLVAVLLFGNLSDRIGRRLVLIPGVLLGALSMVLFVFANGVPALSRRASPPASRWGSSPARARRR